MDYFVCHWIIRPRTSFKFLNDTSKKCDCELAIISDTLTSQDGYKYFDLLLKTDNRQSLNEYIKTAGQQLGMSDWSSTSEEHYAKGILLDNILDLKETSSPLMVTKWIDEIRRLGLKNEELTQKLKGQN